MEQEKYIPGIFNYCDSWCERCPFTNRCRSYDPRHAQAENDSGALLEMLHDSLQEAMTIIREHVEEQGFDWDEFQEEAENTPYNRPELTVAQEKLMAMARRYSQMARSWLEQHRPLLQSRGDELSDQLEMGLPVREKGIELADALEVIQWYLFLIQTKLHRALQGLHDDFPLETDPVQNDANGSAKVSLIAVENSLAAWEVVRERFPEQTDSILDLLVLLGRLRSGIEHIFVHVREFIRPGFDEIPAS